VLCFARSRSHTSGSPVCDWCPLWSLVLGNLLGDAYCVFCGQHPPGWCLTWSLEARQHAGWCLSWSSVARHPAGGCHIKHSEAVEKGVQWSLPTCPWVVRIRCTVYMKTVCTFKSAMKITQPRAVDFSCLSCDKGNFFFFLT
jgi:hypothetical protein